MNKNETDAAAYNRRDFLKGGSVATLMTMLGGVELIAQPAPPAAEESKTPAVKTKVAVIGLGAWGRDILNALATKKLTDITDVVAICDTYPASLKRGGNTAPKAVQTNDYKTILDNKDIPSVIIATPTHQHKDIVLAALKAGKHVYCEAPLANTIEDARTIALEAKAAKKSIFQAGFQMRAEPQRHFLLSFIRSGAVGQFVMARAQWHKKQSWRAPSPNAQREKELNWRLDKGLSTGLMGEIGSHQIDQASWYLNALPRAITGFSSLAQWKDGRDVPDTAQVMVEYPNGVNLIYDASLANSFDANYEMIYGTDAAVMMRDNKAWLFKEVDSPLLGWEVYARKEKFYEETGIALVANASKSVQQPTATTGQSSQVVSPSLASALEIFLRNAADLSAAQGYFVETYGADADPNDLIAQLAKVPRRPASGYLEAYQATVTGIKANEAALAGKRVVLGKDLYELG